MVAINDVDDNEVESMETFMVSVTSNDPEAVAVRPTAMVTIFDNESKLLLLIMWPEKYIVL